MSLVSHAERELDIIELGEPERSAILNAVAAFAEGDWSGGSAGWGIETLTRLLRFQPLTAISRDPREWQEITDDRTSGHPVWQNRRRSTTFSRDGGKTWYDIGDSTLNNGDVWDRDAGNWEDVLVGNNVKVGSIVRVKLDAYDYENSEKINGAVGRVTSIRYGELSVYHDDGSSYNHHADKLQVLKT